MRIKMEQNIYSKELTAFCSNRPGRNVDVVMRNFFFLGFYIGTIILITIVLNTPFASSRSIILPGHTPKIIRQTKGKSSRETALFSLHSKKNYEECNR